MNFVGIN